MIHFTFHTSMSSESLFDAIKRKDVSAVRALIANGADPRVVNFVGHTPLHTASVSENAEIVKTLIAAGANLEALTVTGETPLSFAILSENAECARVLLAAGANPYVGLHEEYKYTLLHRASSNETADCLRMLLAIGFDPSVVDATRWTSLHEAVLNGRIHCVRALLAAGADPRAKDSGGNTPLHGACECGKVGCARLLLSAGADVHAVNKKEKTILWLSINNPTFDLIFESVLWLGDEKISEIPDVRVVKYRRTRKEMVNIRRVRDLLRPLVDPRQKHRRRVLYRDSPLLALPWELCVEVLSFVTWRPIWPTWGREEFER